MANTSPRPSIQERPSQELLEDLCIELRHVACSDYYLPAGERVVGHIGEVTAIHKELDRRGVSFRERLAVLTEETKWQIIPLLDDCLAYPASLPYVRDMDGIRRSLRCHLCQQAERPADAKVFWFCERCMQQVVQAIRQRSPLPGIVLFRTFTTDCRCSHASDETVLASDPCTEQLCGVCERCVAEEISRRKNGEP